MENNFVSATMNTGFYVNLENKTYGIYINMKDIDKSEELIKEIIASNKDSIQAWQREWSVVNVWNYE